MPRKSRLVGGLIWNQESIYIRPFHKLSFWLPDDLTQEEADNIADFIKSIPSKKTLKQIKKGPIK